METLFRKAGNFADEFGMLCRGDSILAAVSGGPDSVFLLHFLARAAGERGARVSVSYIHHHMRREAEEEAVFVKGLAESFGLDFYRGDIRVEGISGIEEKGRILRYRELCRISASAGCKKIATGHTLDDQAETLLMHLVRGTGLAGLRGMLPVSPVPGSPSLLLVRPLLGIDKPSILGALVKAAIPHRMDSYNLSPDFFRNRIRKEAIPLLERYNPSFKENLGRTALLLQSDFEFLQGEALCRGVDPLSAALNGMEMEPYRSMHLSVKRVFISLLIGASSGNMHRSFDSIEKARKRLDSVKSCRLGPAQLRSILEDRPMDEKSPGSIRPVILDVPGRAVLEDGRAAISSEVPVTRGMFTGKDSFTCFLDAGRTGGKLIARGRKKGDMFSPLGMGGRRKSLSRFLMDRKVEKPDRDRIILFESRGVIAWVCGLEVSEEFKVTEKTERAVRISVTPGD